jgi:ubiquinol-cytochrome c reductase iron-sulfur subunit
MSNASLPIEPAQGTHTRRDFFYLATASMAAVGAAATIWPLIDQMNPDAETIAAAGPVDIDLTPLQPGQQMVIKWSAHPVFVVRRTAEALAALQTPEASTRLRDPDSKEPQQPDYAANWHRSINPEYLVLVGVCTHLGCVPTYTPTPSKTDPVPDWPGGYLCHCHGSKYDLAGRVFTGVPAPYNLPVPPYSFPKTGMLRVGENPKGEKFDFNSILQI